MVTKWPKALCVRWQCGIPSPCPPPRRGSAFRHASVQTGSSSPRCRRTQENRLVRLAVAKATGKAIPSADGVYR
jgi:hypothetical protein